MAAPLIVVIDDQQVMRTLFRMALREAGYRVATFETETPAFAHIRNEPPDLLILDLWLDSGVSGWDICAELAQDPATARLPIIICSGVGPARREQPEHIHPPYLAFLDKPFHIQDMLDAVESALASSRLRQH